MHEHRQHFADDMIAKQISLETLLRGVMTQAWFTPVEIDLWFGLVMKNTAEYSYLQYCIYSLACVRRDRFDHATVCSTSAEAYEHHMTASALFRRDVTALNADNWIATKAFHVFTLVFQLVSQSSCPNEQFDLVGTLKVLQSSYAMEVLAEPFFSKSRLWELIRRRPRPVGRSNVEPLYENLSILEIMTCQLETTEPNRAAILSQALSLLRSWAHACDTQPVFWGQYCQWPGNLDSDFLDILAMDDSIALILVIHWCAVLYWSPKPSVFLWAKRTANYAAERLLDRDSWRSLLRWPFNALHMDKGEHLTILPIKNSSRILDLSKQMDLLSFDGSPPSQNNEMAVNNPCEPDWTMSLSALQSRLPQLSDSNNILPVGANMSYDGLTDAFLVSGLPGVANPIPQLHAAETCSFSFPHMDITYGSEMLPRPATPTLEGHDQ
ncbi:hypothetical protein ACEQ8H_004656 [Pleosporales sp. CAS-2024a]